MSITPCILGLDASSVAIGWVIYNGAVIASGEVALKHDDIAERCRLAYAALSLILVTYPGADAIALEAPASRFKKSLIPQCRVSGALMACASLSGLLVVEVTPSQAKWALCSKGNAGKAEMQVCARCWGVTGEHAADSLGVALAAVSMITVERQAA